MDSVLTNGEIACCAKDTLDRLGLWGARTAASLPNGVRYSAPSLVIDVSEYLPGELENFGVKRSRKAVYDSVHKDILSLADGASPAEVVFDDQEHWLFVSVHPETNQFLHVWLFPATTAGWTENLLDGLQLKTIYRRCPLSI